MAVKKHKVEFAFLPGDYVIIDGCKDTKVVVVSCEYRGGICLYRVEWMSGPMQSCIVEEWRLEQWDA